MDKSTLLKLFYLDTKDRVITTVIGIIVGLIGYILAFNLKLPNYVIASVVEIRVDLTLIVITIIAVFCGPIAGFTVGLIGSLTSELLFYHQIIAFGMINLAYGTVGLIVGLPKYYKENNAEKFADGKTFGKFILLLLAVWFLLQVLYLISLLGFAGQSFEGTLLYNFLPFFSVTFVTLALIAPVAVRITDIIIWLLTSYVDKKKGSITSEKH